MFLVFYRIFFLGKVLRIDVDIEVDYSYIYKIFLDNLFINDLFFRLEIYVYGIRNMWRCGKDIGDLVIGVLIIML